MIPGHSPGFRTPSLTAFAWRATADISAEVFSMCGLLHGGHSWKQQWPFKDKPHDYDDGVPLPPSSSISSGHRVSINQSKFIFRAIEILQCILALKSNDEVWLGHDGHVLQN